MRAILTVLLLPGALVAQSSGQQAGGNSLLTPAPRTQEEDARRRTPIVQAVEKAAESVINIYVQVGEALRTDVPFATQGPFMAEGAGSGVIIDTSGLAITNWHVVSTAVDESGAEKPDHRVEIKLIDETIYQASVLSIDPSNDLALLQIQLPEGQTLQAVELGDSDSLLLGETMIAIGNPLGRASTVTRGILSAIDQEVQVRSADGLLRRYKGLLQTDTPINPGNSGGALIDINGKLVGINNAKSQIAVGIGFAIPVSTVRAVFRDTLSSVDGLRGVFLGLQVEDVDGGVSVVEVDPNGPAGRAGVRIGDRLIEAGNKPVASSIDWSKTMMGASAERDLPLVIARDGQQMRFEPRPLANEAYGVLRMTGIELEQVSIADAEQAIRDAYLSLARYSSGVPTAEPAEYPASALRVRDVRQGSSGQEAGVRKGDFLVGVETFVTGRGGFDISSVSQYDRLEQIYGSFVELTKNGAITGDCLLWRDGRILPRPLKIEKLQ